MMLKGIAIGVIGLALLILALYIPFLSEYKFLLLLKILSIFSLALISVILLLIAWKLIRFNPPPPAAFLTQLSFI